HGVTSDAGIVDCDIDAADALDRRVDDCLNTGTVCHIGRRASNLLDPLPRTSQSRLAAIDRGDRRPRLREQLDNLVADALRGPGDENALAVKVEVDVHGASLACFGGTHSNRRLQSFGRRRSPEGRAMVPTQFGVFLAPFHADFASPT